MTAGAAIAFLVLAVVVLLAALGLTFRAAAAWRSAADRARADAVRWQLLAAELEAERLLRRS